MKGNNFQHPNKMLISLGLESLVLSIVRFLNELIIVKIEIDRSHIMNLEGLNSFANFEARVTISKFHQIQFCELTHF